MMSLYASPAATTTPPCWHRKCRSIDYPIHLQFDDECFFQAEDESIIVIERIPLKTEPSPASSSRGNHHRRWGSACSAPGDLCSERDAPPQIVTPISGAEPKANSCRTSSGSATAAQSPHHHQRSQWLSSSTSKDINNQWYHRSSNNKNSRTHEQDNKATMKLRPSPLSLFSQNNNNKTTVLVDVNIKSCMPKESNVAEITSRAMTCCDTHNVTISSGARTAERAPTDGHDDNPSDGNGASSSRSGVNNDNKVTTACGGCATTTNSSMSPVKSFVQGMVHAVENVQEHHRKARYRKRISQCLITLRAAAEVIEDQKRQKREDDDEEEHDDHNKNDCHCSVVANGGNNWRNGSDCFKYNGSDNSASSSSSSSSPAADCTWGSALFSPLDPHPLHHYHNAYSGSAITAAVSRNSSSTDDEDQTDTRDPPVTSAADATEVGQQDEDEEKEEEEKQPVCIIPEPESLLSCNPRLLTQTMFQQLIDEGVPSALHMNAWERVFSIGRDGDAFRTLLEHCAPYQYTILVVQTTTGHLLGGFVSDAWREQDGFARRHSYYGTGVSFLFADHPKTTTTTTQSTDNKRNPTNDDKPLTIYPWTGKNDFCQICDKDKSILAMGGSGAFGFILEDDFYKGSTDHCGTFGNPPLTPDKDGIFTVASMEVYGLVPYGLLQDYYHSNGSLCASSYSTTESPRSVVQDPKFNIRSLILHSNADCGTF